MVKVGALERNGADLDTAVGAAGNKRAFLAVDGRKEGQPDVGVGKRKGWRLQGRVIQPLELRPGHACELGRKLREVPLHLEVGEVLGVSQPALHRGSAPTAHGVVKVLVRLHPLGEPTLQLARVLVGSEFKPCPCAGQVARRWGSVKHSPLRVGIPSNRSNGCHRVFGGLWGGWWGGGGI